MARPSRSRPLLCIDIAADALHATFLPKGQSEPRLSGVVPATATPVELAHGDIGWRVGDIAHARRLVDAQHTVAGVPGYVARQAADSAEAWVEGSMPFVDEAVAAHESLELPMAHLLAHATRKAMGEQEPAFPMEDEASQAEERSPAEEPVGDVGSEGVGDAAEEDEEASAADGQSDHPNEEVGESEHALPAAAQEFDAAEASPTALALVDAETLLLVSGGVGASAQQALAHATELAGLPAPSVMLRDEAVAWATWQLARAETHAERVREQMAREAQRAKAAPRVFSADNETPRTEAEEAASTDDASALPEAARDVAEETMPAPAETSDVVESQEGEPREDGTGETEAAEEGTAEASDEAGSTVPDAPRAWWHVAIEADGFSVCRVETNEDGPRVTARARTSHASLQAVTGRAFAWACEAWDHRSDAPALDALAERRLIDASSKAFRHLSQTSKASLPPKSVTLSVPALALEDGDVDAAPALLGLDIELPRAEALHMLEPLLSLAMGTIDDVVPQGADAPKKATGKRRKKEVTPVAADAEGLVVSGDIDAWPGLREALLARFSESRWMTAPSPDAIAKAARLLLDGLAAAAA